MTREAEREADFAAQYAAHSKAVFTAIVRDELAKGANADEQARIYAELGKPDFALAYLLAGRLPDTERRGLLARAYERRAEQTEAKAHEFDRSFHRPFPLLVAEAAHDRTTARRIHAGQELLADTFRQLPQS